MKISRRALLQTSSIVGMSLAAQPANALPFIYDEVTVDSCIDARQLNPTDQIMQMLGQLRHIHHGFPVDQLEHALQTGTRARRAGMDREIVVASLCHDMAKVISPFSHEVMAAEILKPYVRDEVYNMLRYHGIFQGRFFWQHIGRDHLTYEKYQNESWYRLAFEFTRDLDAPAFDLKYQSDSLESFQEDIAALVNAKKTEVK